MDDFLNDLFPENEGGNDNKDSEQENREIPVTSDSGSEEYNSDITNESNEDYSSSFASNNTENQNQYEESANAQSSSGSDDAQKAVYEQPAGESYGSSQPAENNSNPYSSAAENQNTNNAGVYQGNENNIYNGYSNGYGGPSNNVYGAGYNQNYSAQPQNNYPQSDRKVFYQPPVSQADTAKSKKHSASSIPFDANKQKKKSNAARIIIIIILVIAVAAAGFGIGYAVNNSSSSGSSSSSSSSDSESSSGSGSGSSKAEAKVKSSDSAAKKTSSGDYTVAGVVEKVKSSCVGITVYAQQNNDFSDFYNFGSSDSSSSNGETEAGEGSGVIMSEADGKTYIMTCAHVVSDGSKFKVTLDNDKEYDATLVGSDSQTDIAVLSINATGLNVAEFGDSKDIEVGSDCVAIGCPGGLEFKNSVTKGIVSALDVPVSSSIGYDNECIQVDAAINPGNSGGALFNMQGQVIGINSSKIASTEYEGMGFAVPSDTAVSTANSLIKNGYVKGRAKLGISYAPLSALTSGSDQILAALEQQGFKDAEGAMIIREVSSDSDLNGKVQQNDMIVAVNGKTLTSTDVLTSVLSKSKPGDTVKLTIARIEGSSIRTFNVNCKLIESKE